MKRKLFCISFALLLLFSLSIIPAIPAMAADYDVYDGQSIQTAINGASDGDVIYVHEGTYAENVLIDGVDVSLIAVGYVSITGSTNSYSQKTIAIYNSTCTIDGFTVTGNGSSIYARGMDSYGDGEVNVTIINNYVTDYIKNGITINGELATGFVKDNMVVSDADSVYAQNGIQFGYGATGQAHDNIINTDWYEGENWTASGILIFESDDVSIKQNEVYNAQTGIAIETWGWFCASASGNKVVNNFVQHSEYGITITALSWDAYSTMDSIANNNKVTNNVVSDTMSSDGIIGIYVGAYYDSGDYTPEADNNKVVNNDVSGFEEDVVDEGTATKIHANKFPLE